MSVRDLLAALVMVVSATPSLAATTTETILVVRHAEKPPGGLGQLSCKGLNRSLAIARMIEARFGRPDAVFAPDPSHPKPDGAGSFDYVRPLATVEPTAIRFGLPVHSEIAYTDLHGLRAALLAPGMRDKTVLVGWEHHQIRDLVRDIAKSFGDPDAATGDWPFDDFDSVWKLTITWDGDNGHLAFAHEHEGLDGQSPECP